MLNLVGNFHKIGESWHVTHSSVLKSEMNPLYEIRPGGPHLGIFVEPIRSRLAFILFSRLNEWPDHIETDEKY